MYLQKTMLFFDTCTLILPLISIITNIFESHKIFFIIILFFLPSLTKYVISNKLYRM